MAGSITVTKTDLGGSITKYAIAWTADGSGAVNANSFDIKRGRMVAAKFVSGTPTPTTGYTIKLADLDGADLLGGTGAAVATPAASYAEPALGYFPAFIEGFSAVIPTVTGAGANAQGALNLYVGP